MFVQCIVYAILYKRFFFFWQLACHILLLYFCLFLKNFPNVYLCDLQLQSNIVQFTFFFKNIVLHLSIVGLISSQETSHAHNVYIDYIQTALWKHGIYTVKYMWHKISLWKHMASLKPSGRGLGISLRLMKHFQLQYRTGKVRLLDAKLCFGNTF